MEKLLKICRKINAFGVAAGVLAFAGHICSMPLVIRQVKIKTPNLPKELIGLRILHISDLHANNGRAMLDGDELAALDFDLVALTGDIIQNNAKQFLSYSSLIKKLTKKAPVFFVDGNHDNRDYRALRRLIISMGIINVAKSSKFFRIKNRYVCITGFSDFSLPLKIRGDYKREIRKIKKTNDFNIILAHQPQIFSSLEKARVNSLVLAGHTHAGHVRLPPLPTLIAPGQGFLPKYGRGLYIERKGKLQMFISAGVGRSTFFLKTFNPREIALLELCK